MKKIILAVAVLFSVSTVNAQAKRTITASTDPVTANAIAETNKLESLKLTAQQDEAIYKVNYENAKSFYSTSTPGAVDQATVKRNKAKQDMEYKKILTADQYKTWSTKLNK